MKRTYKSVFLYKKRQNACPNCGELVIRKKFGRRSKFCTNKCSVQYRTLKREMSRMPEAEELFKYVLGYK
jgi:endogenous inhibitor of DNA gyrase (YacG/DUF329 family)